LNTAQAQGGCENPNDWDVIVFHDFFSYLKGDFFFQRL